MTTETTTAVPASVNPALPRIYIAGPMTGLPENNYPAFAEAATTFRSRGYHVENPAELLPSKPLPEMTWLDWMRLTVPQMLTCDLVIMLPGWQDSKGATIETDLARGLGMRCLTLGWTTRNFTGVPTDPCAT